MSKAAMTIAGNYCVAPRASTRASRAGISNIRRRFFVHEREARLTHGPSKK
jgi:hypothetical protein